MRPGPRRRHPGRLVVVAGLVLAGCAPDSDDPAAAPSATDAPAVDAQPGPAAASDTSARHGTVVTDPAAKATSLGLPGRCDPAAADGTVEIWHSFGGEVAPAEFDALLAEFNATHAVQATATEVGGYQDMLAALGATDPAAWPDVVIAPESATRAFLDSAKFVLPGECTDTTPITDDLLPVVAATYSVGDQLVALPYGVSAPVLFFDANELRAAGLDPERPPLTVDELLDASRRIVDAGVTRYGLVLHDSLLHWVLEQYPARRDETIATSDNGRSPGEVDVDYATAENAAIVAAYRQGVIDGHVFWQGELNASYEDLIKIVDLEDGATMSIHTSASVGDVISYIESGSFPGVTLGVGPMPGPGSGSLVGGNAIWLIDSADPAAVGAAWEVAAWLTDAPRLAAFTAATGYVPATTSAVAEPVLAERWAKYPQLRVAYDQLAPMPGTPATAGLLIGPAVPHDDVLYAASNSIMRDGADIGAKLDEITALTNELIDGYEADIVGAG